MKKVLIISYYWPPNTGSGVQRWLKFSKYLKKNKWEPIIVTPNNPYSELSDKKLSEDIEDINVLKFPIWEPYSLKDKIFGKSKKSQNSGLISKDKTLKDFCLNWIRGNFFIPDPKKYFIKPTIKSLIKYIEENKINHIISTGPPHSMHLIGLGIKKRFNQIKWIADFRDPWSKLDLLDDFHLTKRARFKHMQLEKQVLENSDLVLTVSEKWAKDFNNLGASNVKIITNGYDKEDFIDFTISKSEKFVIGHYGILNHLRNPIELWKSLNELCKSDTEFNNRLEIHLSGNIDPNVIECINKYEFLKDKLHLLGFLNHNDVIKAYSKTSLLLLLLFNSESGKGNYPGKLFEYLATKLPILAFGPKNSDVQNFLNNSYGSYFSYDNNKNVKDEILSIFNNKIKYKHIQDDRFTREKLTLDLVNILDKL
ncbi:MAG: glycosyl transferase family 1 [Flavobacteriales bacterium]|nr:glycosyl transferase family 1 [Flavobacteriales bacterium]